MKRWCAAGCGKMVKLGEAGHVYRDRDRILMFHKDCCPVCPQVYEVIPR